MIVAKLLQKIWQIFFSIPLREAKIFASLKLYLKLVSLKRGVSKCGKRQKKLEYLVSSKLKKLCPLSVFWVRFAAGFVWYSTEEVSG